MDHKLITIFTPTYNRGYCLPALYQSLKRQTSRNFIWLIIDDGSTDDTASQINGFIAERCVDIQVGFQKNSGKHVAHNRAVRECTTELFYCVDSDDELPGDAVESIEQAWNALSAEERKTVSGIVGYKAYKDSGIVGTEFPQGVLKSSLKGLYSDGKTGDTALIYRTEIIKEYPFQVFEGERFLRENTAYDLIDDHYDLLVLRKNLYLCEYLPDGLSRNATRLEFESPRGAAFFRLHEAQKAVSAKSRLRNFGAFIFFSIKGGQTKEAVQKLGWIRFLLLLPVASAAFLRYRIRLSGIYNK